MTPADITSTFNNNSNLYKALKEEIVFEITETLNKTDVKYHSVTARVKDLSSLLLKVENKEVSDPFTEVADIVGARVVTLFLSDIEKIVRALHECFDVYLVDNKIDDADPRLFGYFSVHLHARIKENYAGTRYDKIKKLGFEVQIRTIAMDAWASASHYLDYKSDADVPADLRRDFNALSGLFYVADKHFETFFRSRSARLKRIDRAFKDSKPPLHEPINLDNLTAFLHDRYPDRQHADSGHVSFLLSDLRELGFVDLATVAEALDAKEADFIAYEKLRGPIPGTDDPSRMAFTDVGVVRVSLKPGHMTTKPPELT